jgi:hypothetical protein
MAYTTNGSDQFALPQRTRLGAGDESNLRAQTPTSFEGFQTGQFYPDLTKAKNDALKSKQGPLQQR